MDAVPPEQPAVYDGGLFARSAPAKTHEEKMLNLIGIFAAASPKTLQAVSEEEIPNLRFTERTEPSGEFRAEAIAFHKANLLHLFPIIDIGDREYLACFMDVCTFPRIGDAELRRRLDAYSAGEKDEMFDLREAIQSPHVMSIYVCQTEEEGGVLRF